MWMPFYIGDGLDSTVEIGCSLLNSLIVSGWKSEVWLLEKFETQSLKFKPFYN